jgi:hypothetical protein
MIFYYIYLWVFINITNLKNKWVDNVNKINNNITYILKILRCLYLIKDNL